MKFKFPFFLCKRKMTKISKQLFENMLKTEWEFDSWYQTLPPVTNISFLTPLLLILTDALKTATKINIPEKMPLRVLISVFTFMHACIHTQWKLKMEIICTSSEQEGWEREMSSHPLFSTLKQHQQQTGETAKMKKNFKIICAVWFDDVSPANHLMIIYCRCR